MAPASYADTLAEIERLRAENAALRARIAPGYYETNGVFRFRGKSEVKRQNTNLGLPCGCRAYLDVLTPGRWRALGRRIRAGESAILRVGRRANTPVFCRCQLEAAPIDPKDIYTETGDINDIPGF